MTSSFAFCFVSLGSVLKNYNVNAKWKRTKCIISYKKKHGQRLWDRLSSIPSILQNVICRMDGGINVILSRVLVLALFTSELHCYYWVYRVNSHHKLCVYIYTCHAASVFLCFEALWLSVPVIGACMVSGGTYTVLWVSEHVLGVAVFSLFIYRLYCILRIRFILCM